MNKTNDRWSALSMKDRADLIKLYVESGITNINNIRKDYNSFATGGPVEELDPSVVVDYSNLKQEAKDARDWVIDYYKSEGYKQRAEKAGLSTKYPLIKSLGIFPKKKIDFLEDESVDNSYNSSYPVIGLKESEEKWTSNHVDDIGYVTAHEFAHYNKDFHRKTRNENKAYLSPFYGYDYTDLPQEYFNALGVNYRTNAHDSEFNESYSDLIGLRYLLNKYNVFDSTDPNAKFDYKLYKNIMKDERFKNNRFLKLHDESQVIKALNDVAQNISNPNKLTYTNPENIAAKGGKLLIKSRK